jgi:hypothetical protein
MRTIQDMIQQEVLCCMSSMVANLAEGDQFMPPRKRDFPIAELCAQALELTAPIPDYEEAAIQNGWRNYDGVWINKHDGDDGETYRNVEILCDQENIEPYDREVFEHWAVTDWFADKLEAAGEKVDKDFAGLCIWARTTTGQAIYADGVIERIYAETHKADAA